MALLSLQHDHLLAIVLGHMTSNNETVYRQNAMSEPLCGNYDIKRETVHCYPQNVKHCCVKRACSLMWPDAVDRISAPFSKFAFVLFCRYNTEIAQ